MDLALGSLIGAGIEAGASLISNAFNLGTSKKALNYQKALTNQVFNREDTAVQRRIQDLKAAGINPILAAGSAAESGQAIGYSAPQISPEIKAMQAIQAMQSIKESKERIKNIEANTKKAEADTDVSRNQSKFIFAQTRNANMDFTQKSQNYARDVYDFELAKSKGTYSNGTNAMNNNWQNGLQIANTVSNVVNGFTGSYFRGYNLVHGKNPSYNNSSLYGVTSYGY